MNAAALRDLPVEQRLHLVEELWDSIAADQGALGLTDAQRQELDKRLDAYELDRDPGRPLDDVLTDIRTLTRYTGSRRLPHRSLA